MTRTDINRALFFLPLIFSAAAFAIAIVNIAAGVPPQADENASAHLWQLLMIAQLPLILLFLATAERRALPVLLMVGLQLGAVAAACIPVWLAGY